VFLQAALDVYRSTRKLTGDIGLLLHELMCAPALLWSEYQTEEFIRRIETNLLHLSTIEINVSEEDPIFILRQLPVNIQYLGRPPSYFYEILSNFLVRVNPSLQESYLTENSNSNGKVDDFVVTLTIRLGIISGKVYTFESTPP
jgi:hypothetical protein